MNQERPASARSLAVLSWLAFLAACSAGSPAEEGDPRAMGPKAADGGVAGDGDAGVSTKDAGDDGLVSHAEPGDAATPVASHSTFTQVYLSTLSPVCTACHGGSGAVAGLDMSSKSSAYANLVGVSAKGSACGASGLVRVDPGSADRSLLYLKVSGTQPCGARMPFGGPALADEAIGAIASWIDSGAADD